MTQPRNPADMPAEDFRRFGHEMIDWMADYLADPRVHPVLTSLQPGELMDRLPGSGPEHGEGMEAILEDFRQLIVPATTHWNHPRFMAYFPSSSSAPGILGEMLAATLNSNHLVWKGNPAGSELEQVTLGWLRQWLGLPPEFFGQILDTASTATLHAIAAARVWAAPETRAQGAPAGMTIYASEHAHSSVEKGAMVLGIGQDNVRKVPADSEFRMRVNTLAEMIRADRAAGKRPFCVVPTIGTTSIASIDPVPAIIEIARHEKLWVHVDSAYAGSAAVIPEYRFLLDGCAQADSLVMNPHKWLLTPVDISAFYCRHPGILRRTFSLIPEYLKTGEDDRALNFMDYGVPLGRRFRALKLWFVMRYFGREGISAILRNHIRWAAGLAREITRDERFEVTAPTLLSLVCFRYRGTNQQNQTLLEAVNASGQTFLSGNTMNGVFMIRLAMGNLRTTEEDVAAVWRLIQEKAATL